MKIKTIWSPLSDPEEFDDEVNEALEDGWQIANLSAPTEPGWGSIKYVAFLFRDDE